MNYGSKRTIRPCDGTRICVRAPPPADPKSALLFALGAGVGGGQGGRHTRCQRLYHRPKQLVRTSDTLAPFAVCFIIDRAVAVSFCCFYRTFFFLGSETWVVCCVTVVSAKHRKYTFCIVGFFFSSIVTFEMYVQQYLVLVLSRMYLSTAAASLCMKR